MTLNADSAANRIALVAQLYDDWQGHYIVTRIEGGAYVDVKPLKRAEALTYRAQAGEALRLVWSKTE